MNADPEILLSMALLFGFLLPVTLAVVIPWSRARARRQAGTGGTDHETAVELDLLRDRLAELEERLNFTERLVTDAREQLRLRVGQEGDA